MTLARIEDRGDHIAIINRNAAKRGALSVEYYEAVMAGFKAAQERRIRAVLLTSEGGFFCAGGDLTVLIERHKLPEDERHQKIDALHDMIRAIRASAVPVVCAIEGGAAGAGLSIALACDLIVAAEDAKFTAAYVKAGLVPDGGLTSALARAVPRQMAMEMCLLGRSLPVTRFAEAGVVTALTAPGAADQAAADLVARLTAGPRDAQGVIRTLVADAYDLSEEDQLAAEQIGMARAQGGAEAAEGIAAFLEKRPPRFGDLP